MIDMRTNDGPHAAASRCDGALLGMFVGDALAMPVHWYYDTFALRQDYGTVDSYRAPKNPHPGSILFRSSYTPPNAKGDILHDQKQYWGRQGIHYHQFLAPGENTLNLKLARLLLTQVAAGGYDPEAWLDEMIRFLTTPGTHNDTYVEEYLRHFFTNYANGMAPAACGRRDEKHIGGYSLMLPLVIALHDRQELVDTALAHLELTHGGAPMRTWGRFICRLLAALLQGSSLPEGFDYAQADSEVSVVYGELESLTEFADETVVTRHFSSACYVQLSVPATLYLAVKYQSAPAEALIANTMCGGDNCGRGALLGALLGALNGESCWPRTWVDGLVEPPPRYTEIRS